jgi:AI-2 transport protein TqsA
MTENGPHQKHRVYPYLVGIITLILTGWALRATGSVMVPIVFSVILALLIAPIDRWVSDRVPSKFSWLGHVAAMGVILLVLLAVVGAMWLAAQQIIARFPDESGEGASLSQLGAEWLPGTEESSADTGADQQGNENQSSPSTSGAESLRQYFSMAGESLIGRLGEWASGLAAQILGMAGATLSGIVLIFFLTLIMMIEAVDWRKKVVTVLDVSARQEALESISIIADRLRRYLLSRAILGAITAVLYVGWLWIFGVDLLIVWAVIVFLLGFIPTFGSLISGALPVIYAFVQKDFATAMGAGIGVLVIEQIMGNFIDPRVQGRQLSLSTLVVLITLLIWTWIWGVAGAILAVPITIATMIISAHVPRLRPFALFLSDATEFDALDRQARDSDR